MMTVKEISDRLSLTEWKTRRLIYALREPLLPYSKGGQGRALLIDQSALGILERASQLHDSGILLQELSNAVASELGDAPKDRFNGEKKALQKTATSELTTARLEQELVVELRGRLADAQSRIESLERDKTFLQAKLGDAIETIKALPVPRPAESQQQTLSRWQALRLALMGR